MHSMPSLGLRGLLGHRGDRIHTVLAPRKAAGETGWGRGAVTDHSGRRQFSEVMLKRGCEAPRSTPEAGATANIPIKSAQTSFEGGTGFPTRVDYTRIGRCPSSKVLDFRGRRHT
ncbi:hypothetical protein NDU88_003761 [Pleurodeles waltl]|uniref:Uncharacterized protein n=1 Tax=Pleurodeles waltl TaxID=8319 RepID=A0AAV7WQC3_PLEWA|nr:hypothetical protein NDU88_003761 [Pleurodeles waltl]